MSIQIRQINSDETNQLLTDSETLATAGLDFE